MSNGGWGVERGLTVDPLICQLTSVETLPEVINGMSAPLSIEIEFPTCQFCDTVTECWVVTASVVWMEIVC